MSDRPMTGQPAAGQPASGPEQANAVLPPGFDAFYDRTYYRVLAYARKLAGNIADAEQAVVDAYTVTALRWDRVGGYESPEAYVRKIVRRHIAKAIRQWWRRQDPGWLRNVPLPPPPADPELSAEARELLALFQLLSKAQRQVLELHCQGLTSSEIAQELGMKPTTVRTHLERARARLRNALGLWPKPEGNRGDEFAPAAASKGRPGEPGTGRPERDPLAEFLAGSHQALLDAIAADEERKARVRAEIIARLGGQGRPVSRRRRR